MIWLFLIWLLKALTCNGPTCKLSRFASELLESQKVLEEMEATPTCNILSSLYRWRWTGNWTLINFESRPGSEEESSLWLSITCSLVYLQVRITRSYTLNTCLIVILLMMNSNLHLRDSSACCLPVLLMGVKQIKAFYPLFVIRQFALYMHLKPSIDLAC